MPSGAGGSPLTPYLGWLLAALVLFTLGAMGVSLWLASSYLAILPRKRARVVVGAAAMAALLLSGWLPGARLYRRIAGSPSAPVSLEEVAVLAYLHLGAVTGLWILLLGRRRAARAALPPAHEVDLGLGKRLLDLHRSREPRNLFLRLPSNCVYAVKRRDWVVPVEIDGRPLPADLEGFTILHLSDVHHGRYLLPEYLEAVREAARGLEHDAVAFTGDFIHRGEPVEGLADWLGGFRFGSEAFAVLGNHDLLDHQVPALKAAISSAGLRLLGGESALVRRGSAAVAFAGIDYQNWWRPFPVEEARRRIPEGAVPVLITHTPCLFPRAARAGFALVLCGHTHGGQVRVPGVGALFVPARYGRRYQMGLYQDGRSFLHVHPGMGGPPPWRLACPPEITRLILTRDRR